MADGIPKTHCRSPISRIAILGIVVGWIAMDCVLGPSSVAIGNLIGTTMFFDRLASRLSDGTTITLLLVSPLLDLVLVAIIVFAYRDKYLYGVHLSIIIALCTVLLCLAAADLWVLDGFSTALGRYR